MRFFKKKPDKTTLVFECKAATATRAMRAENRHFPVIEVTYTLVQPKVDKKTGEMIDEITIYMDLDDASDFTDKMLNSLQAAMPKMPRIARQGQWGE